MRPIPKKLREQIAQDPFMKTCIYQSRNAPNHNCRGRITWEHAYTYKNRQINEPALIVPCCENHNSGPEMVKDYNRYRAIIRADIEELTKKYPNRNWKQELIYLTNKFNK